MSLVDIKEDLSNVISPMDLSFLNERIQNPSDLNLANELFQTYGNADLISSHISSSSSQGAGYEGPNTLTFGKNSLSRHPINYPMFQKDISVETCMVIPSK